MNIQELKDIGIGKKCLIVGGGWSVNEFDFSQAKDMTKIAVNDSLYPYNGIRPDYLVHSDKEFIPKLKAMDVEDVKIISFMNFPYWRDHYDYTLSSFSDVGYSVPDHYNTGLKALIIAKHIMKFDEVYLIGFDFHTRIIDGKEVSHHNGDRYGQKEKYIDEMAIRDHFKRLGQMIEQFNVFLDTKGIYNCYKESKLKKFEYKLPEEVTNGSGE